jgi:tagatose 6-phosphate kinase
VGSGFVMYGPSGKEPIAWAVILVISLQLYLQRAQFVGQDLDEGGIMPVHGAHFEAAGGGLVAARALRDLGQDVRLISVKGGDTGDLLQKEIEKEGLSTALVESAAPTPMTFRLHGRHRYGMELEEYREDPIRVGGEEMRDMLCLFDEGLAEASAVLLCGDSPYQGADMLYSEMLRRGHEAGLPVLAKSTGDSLLELLKSGPGVLVARRQDFSHCAKTLGISEAELRDRGFAADTGALVLVQGAKALSLWTQEGCLELMPPDARSRGGPSPGEALSAGLLLRLVEGWDLQPATCYGIAAGTAQSLKPLGGRLCAATIEGFYRQVRAVATQDDGLCLD